MSLAEAVQMELPLDAPEPLPDESSIDFRFERFHAQNPQVYDLLLRYARHLKASGRVRYGVKAFLEDLRWNGPKAIGPDAEGFRINNIFSSRYARRLMAENADLDGFFEVRELKSK